LQEQPKPTTLASSIKPQDILVPVDFSESSIKALHVAAALAAKEHSRVTLLNVVTEPRSFRVLDQPRQEFGQRHENEQRLKKLADRELGPEVISHTIVRRGDPSTEIKRTAAQEHAAMIVLGRHPRHGAGR